MNRYPKANCFRTCSKSSTACQIRNVVFSGLLSITLLIPSMLADDFGLSNPAEKEFSEYKTEGKTAGGFAQKSPAFHDRPVSLPEQTEPIRQVSADEDPFPTATQPPVMQTPFAFEGDNTATAPLNNMLPNNTTPPNNLALAQNNAPAGTYALPYVPMQYAPLQYTQPAAGYPVMDYSQAMQMQQFQMQYPQEYVQPYAAVNPYASMNPYVLYGNMDNSQADMMDNQHTQDYAAVYQALLQQEMAKRQAEESQDNTNDDTSSDSDEQKKQADDSWTFNHLVPVKVSSPLGETLFACAKTISPFYSPTGPDKGVGMPLVNKSWLDHPWYAGGFVGSMSGSELISNMVDQKSGGNGGFLVGYNFNEYWGLESRVHFASMDIFDTDYAIQMRAELYPDVTFLPMTRTNKLTMMDAAVHYYPLGNAKWRPFFKYGLGIGQQKFVDTFGYNYTEDIITMPLGVGLRYWWNERIAVQMDLINNVVFASGIAKTQHNFTFAVGLTYSFGTGNKKPPVHYWPATPSLGGRW